MNSTSLIEGLGNSSSLAPESTIYIFLMFVIFVFLAIEALRLLKNAILAAIVSASFPYIASRFFGLSIEVSLSSAITFALLGVLLYILYEAVSFLYKSSKLAFRLITLVILPFVILFKLFESMLNALLEDSTKDTHKKKPRTKKSTKKPAKSKKKK